MDSPVSPATRERLLIWKADDGNKQRETVLEETETTQIYT